MYIQRTTIKPYSGTYGGPSTKVYSTPTGTPIRIPTINNHGGYYSPPTAVAQRNAARQTQNAKQLTLQKTISNPGGPSTYTQGTGIGGISIPPLTEFDWFIIAGAVILVMALIALVIA